MAVIRRNGEDDDLSPLRVEGYRITGRLGEGGMGVVWRAEQMATGRPVALKMMSLSVLGSRKARARFEREVELTARLEHPGIARLYESGVCRGAFYYAMELIDGLPLDRFAQERRLGQGELCRLVIEVCRAVQHAHGRGVIHRDLKPANVLVTPDGRPHVLDFGLAGATSDPAVSRSLSLDRDVAGTLGFMSPQQATGGAAPDTRDDVYSLGAMLFLLLTGQTPHDLAGTPLQAIRRIEETDAPRPRSLEPSIHADLDAILLKALAREPGRRYASAGELADDLDRHLSGRPVTARPPTLAYFAGKAVRRHRLAVAVAAAFILALAGIAAWAELRVRRERDLAVRERVDADLQRGKARAQQQLAEQRLVDSLVAKGDALAQANRWLQAKQSYDAAQEAAASTGTPDTAADLGLLSAYMAAATPPLNEYHGLSGPVRATAISPDATLVAAGGSLGMVRVWDSASGRPFRLFNGHAREVTCLAFSPDGKRIVSGGKDKTIRVWDLAAGKQVMKLADDEEVKALAISPDGTRLAAISGGKSWGVWDLTDGRRLFTRPHPEHVLSVAFCPDSIHCLIGDQFSTYAWDTATGTEIYTVKSGVTSALVVLPHGNRALVGGTSRPDEGEPLKLWGLTQDGPILARYPGQPCAPRRIALTADATRAVLAGEDGVVREAGLSDRAVRAVCWGDAEPLSAVGLSADHGLAASGSADGTVYLWDTAGSDRKAATIPLPYNYATCVAASGDGSGVLVGKSSRPVEVYSPGMAGMAEFLDGQAGQVQAMAFTPDRSLLVTGAGDGAVRLWQGSSGAAIGVLGRHDLDVRAVACSPDGRYALSVNGNEAKLWDLSRRILLWSRRGGATLGHGATFSADGRAAWAVTVHGRVIGWNVADGSPLPNRTQLQVAGELENTVLFLSDASRILGAENHDIVLWDARTGSIVRKFSGHTDTVETVALSPDSALIASGGQDQTVRVWDLASGKELAVLHEQALPIQHVCFSRDGRWLYSAATDDWIVAWQLDRAEQYRHFQAEARAARESLEANQDNPDALATLARWYQFRHRDDLANRLQNPPGPELGTARQ